MRQVICILIFLSVSSVNILMAQTNRIAMRDSRFLQFQHVFFKHMPLMLEHSIYSEKISLQHFRLYAGYKHQFVNNHLRLQCLAYWGSTHNGMYQDYGAFVAASYHFDSDDNYSLHATLNPHYDTGLNYKTCCSFETYVGVFKVAALYLAFSNIPEFRQPEDRIRAGVRLRIQSLAHGTLSVCPQMSIPLQQRYEKIRLHVNFAYCF